MPLLLKFTFLVFNVEVGSDGKAAEGVVAAETVDLAEGDSAGAALSGDPRALVRPGSSVGLAANNTLPSLAIRDGLDEMSACQARRLRPCITLVHANICNILYSIQRKQSFLVSVRL